MKKYSKKGCIKNMAQIVLSIDDLDVTGLAYTAMEEAKVALQDKEASEDAQVYANWH